MTARTQDKPVIGLIGGIGAGKSTAAAEFVTLSCALIDGDEIGHGLLGEPEVERLLRRRWGQKVFDDRGVVDRRALAEIVFEDPAELDALNRIMHRRIRSRIEAQVARARDDGRVLGVVVDAAVLLEAGWDRLCSHVLFVDAPATVRASRSARRGWTERTWRKREKLQISLDKKKAACYCVLDNSSSVSHLRKQVHQVFHRIIRQMDRS